LGIALAAKDVSCGLSKCDVILLPPPDDLEQLTPVYIGNLIKALRGPNKISNAAYVRCADKLFYVDVVNNRCIGLKLDQATVLQFDTELKPQVKAQLLSKEQLQTVTTITGHVHDEEMAEMIMRHLRRLPDGEKEITEQICEQFPKGWEAQEKARMARDAGALEEVFYAIERAKKIDDLEIAIKIFSDHLENENKHRGIFKTGFYFNDQLEIDARTFFEKKYYQFGGHHSTRNNLIWQKVIGKIQRYATGCTAQTICQGPRNIVDGDEKLRRDLRYRNYGGVHFPLDSLLIYILGHDYAVIASQPVSRSILSETVIYIRAAYQAISNKKHQRCEDLRHSQTSIPRIRAF
jgi:hypothetical protein